LATHTGIGGAALASCPNFALTSLMGSGGAVLGSPLAPVGALLIGALLGSVAGGTTGGALACQNVEERSSVLNLDFKPVAHPEG
jgi:hypothetical protein